MLITCGKCGNDVSDKARSCPKCKTPVKPLAIACPECAKELSEQDLSGDCPHCGFPLRHLRLPAFAASSPLPPAQVPKAAALECANCGCVLPPGIAADGKCPNCGFALRPERPASPGALVGGKPGAKAKAPPSYLEDSKQGAAAFKRAPLEKSRLRIAVEYLLIALLMATILLGGSYLALRGDLFGLRTSLKNASNSEETADSLDGAFSSARLWIKHAVSVVMDQFPDGSGSSPAGVEGQTR